MKKTVEQANRISNLSILLCGEIREVKIIFDLVPVIIKSIE